MTSQGGYGSLLAALGRDGDTMVAHISPYEAALLSALGGRGTTNPHTGLPEFSIPNFGGSPPVSSSLIPQSMQPSYGGGGSTYDYLMRANGADSNVPGWVSDGGTWYGPQGQVGSAPGLSDISGEPQKPTNPTVDPAQTAYYAQQYGDLGVSGDGGGYTNPLISQEGNFAPGPNNPYYTQNPTTGYFDLTPAGIAGIQGDQQTQEQRIATNAAHNRAGIAGMAGTPLGAIGLASIPLALGAGAGLALGAVPAAGLGLGEAGVVGAEAGAAGGALAEGAGVGGALAEGGGLGGAGDVFIGATNSGAAGAAGAIGGDAPIFASGSGSGILGGGAAAAGGGAVPESVASALTYGAAPTIESSAGVGGETAWQALQAGHVGDALGHAGDWFGKALGTSFEKNPLGVIGSTVGLASTLLKGDSNSPAENSLNATANAAGAQGAALANQVLSGQNVLPGQQALQATANSLQQKSQQLLDAANSGKLPQVGASQLLAQANQLALQSNTLRSYLETGTLPPGLQAGVDQAAKAAKAAIRSQYAARGMSNTSSASQDVSNVDTNAKTQAAQIAVQLFSQGLSEAQVANGVYEQLVNASTQLFQLSNQTEQLALSAQENVNTTSIQLLNAALGFTGLDVGVQEALLKSQLAQDQALSQSIANFASSLAGGNQGIKLQIGQGGVTTI